MSIGARPIWLTEDQAKAFGEWIHLMWVAAPADAAEAVARIIGQLPIEEWTHDQNDEAARAVLRALGHEAD